MVQNFAILRPEDDANYGVISVCKEGYGVVLFAFDKNTLRIAFDEGKDIWEREFVIRSLSEITGSPLPETSIRDPIVVGGFAARDFGTMITAYYESAKSTFGVGSRWPLATSYVSSPFNGNFAHIDHWQYGQDQDLSFFNAWFASGDLHSGVNVYVVNSKDQWEMCLEKDSFLTDEIKSMMKRRTSEMLLPDSCDKPPIHIGGQQALLVMASCDYYQYMESVMTNSLNIPECRYALQDGDSRIQLN